MKLIAISRFNWKGRWYEIGDRCEADDAKAAMMIADGHVKKDSDQNQEPEPEKSPAIETVSNPVEEETPKARDVGRTSSTKSKSKKKKS